MPVVLLVRHADNDFVKEQRLAGRIPGVHLNAEGLLQAESLAIRLKEVPIKAIYSSPLERAIETVKPIAEDLHQEIQVCEGFNEIDFGEWQGQKLKDLRKLQFWKIVQNTPSLMRFPGGESFANAQNRVCNQIENLGTLHKPKDIIICVSHSDVIKLAIAYYIGLPLDTFQRLVVMPASISILSLQKHSSILVALNNLSILDSLDRMKV